MYSKRSEPRTQIGKTNDFKGGRASTNNEKHCVNERESDGSKKRRRRSINAMRDNFLNCLIKNWTRRDQFSNSNFQVDNFRATEIILNNVDLIL